MDEGGKSDLRLWEKQQTPLQLVGEEIKISFVKEGEIMSHLLTLEEWKKTEECRKVNEVIKQIEEREQKRLEAQ